MKDLSTPEIDRWRIRTWKVREYFGSIGGASFGYFEIPSPEKGTLRVLATHGDSGEGEEYAWDHVSVSLDKRIPTYGEMCWIKDLFFHDTETVVQYHVPKEDHVNFHPYCLHLWRPTVKDLPRPPSILVGPKARKL